MTPVKETLHLQGRFSQVYRDTLIRRRHDDQRLVTDVTLHRMMVATGKVVSKRCTTRRTLQFFSLSNIEPSHVSSLRRRRGNSFGKNSSSSQGDYSSPRSGSESYSRPVASWLQGGGCHRQESSFHQASARRGSASTRRIHLSIAKQFPRLTFLGVERDVCVSGLPREARLYPVLEYRSEARPHLGQLSCLASAQTGADKDCCR